MLEKLEEEEVRTGGNGNLCEILTLMGECTVIGLYFYVVTIVVGWEEEKKGISGGVLLRRHHNLLIIV